MWLLVRSPGLPQNAHLPLGLIMAKETDPTKDPEFQKVLQTFLHTKPQPHKPKKKGG
jgi:hypothetical protein